MEAWLCEIRSQLLRNLKIKVGIQAIQTRGIIVLQHSSVRKFLIWNQTKYFIKCQSRNFLTELCCNTIIPLVSVVFIA